MSRYTLFQRFVSALCFVCLTTLLVSPAGQAIAATCSLSDSSTAQNQNPACAVVKVGPDTVTYPRLSYQRINAVDFNARSGFSTTALSGKAVQVNLNQAAELLGIPSNKVSDFVSTLPASSAVVFGRYSPNTYQLTIEIVKLTKTGNKVVVSKAAVTPEHGNMWAAARTYMTPAEKLASAGAGPNPFSQFDQGDGIFHNVKLPMAFGIMGAVMRYSRASIAIVSQADSRLSSRTEESGGWLRKTVTTIVEGWIKPTWFVGLPADMQPEGVGGFACAVNEPVCQPGHKVLPYANFQQWTGGNLSEAENKVYDWRESSTSWSVLAMAIFTAVLMFAGAEFIALEAATAGAAEAGTLANLCAEAMASLMNVGVISSAGSLGAGELAAEAGVAYLGVTTVLDGGQGITSPQDSWGGSVGWDVTPPPTAPNDKYAALWQIEGATQTAVPFDGTSTIGVSDPQVSSGAQSATGPFNQGYQQAMPAIGSKYGFNDATYVRDTQ